jgi:hypothetical protein
VLHYDTISGDFTRLVSTSRRVKVGDIAGSIRKDGYLHIRVDGKRYLSHRLAWLYVTGSWPDKFVDHKNTDKADNAWDNLRAATSAQNNRNATLSTLNASGVKGVSYHKANNNWIAYITTNRVRKHLGSFSSIGDATTAVLEARLELHGEFARAA